MPELLVKHLSPGLAGDFFAFFDGPAFADNPKWASCYCFYPHCPKAEDWHARPAAVNRPAMAARIATGLQSGFLAYRDGVVVGWLNAGARAALPHFMEKLEWAGLPGDDPAAIAACTCFVISPSARKTGVAAALLAGACQEFKWRGYTAIESYPVVDPKQQSDAAQHLGPVTLYEKAGFAPIGELDGVIRVMRKKL